MSCAAGMRASSRCLAPRCAITRFATNTRRNGPILSSSPGPRTRISILMANATKLPAVVVIHENRGLNPYIEDVARRLAVANFIAFAPDGLTSLGGFRVTRE